MSSDEVFVRHMIDAIDEIQKMLDGMTYKKFVNDHIRMYASVRLFEVLGEAANKLSSDYQKKYQTIPFADIIGMRNKLIHHYFEVDLEILWKVYEDDLRELKDKLESSLK
ncbi:DUF86 domain-containing protein [Patescibacteria group bacterium]|nr:DUF86 domain-containing protein [Patescibacteria group bacterium]